MSEQTSPPHDDPAATPDAATLLPRPRFEAPSGDAAAVLTGVAIIAILIFGAFLRFSHNNWDQSGSGSAAHSAHLHPDERFHTQISVDTKAPSGILNYFDTETSKLNPYNIDKGNGARQTTFVYGTLPLFLNKFAASHYSALTLGFAGDRDSYDQYHLSGRALAAFFDVGTILLIFLIGWRLANRPVAIMAAFLYAFSPFPIQNAHFFVVDPFVTFFATFTIYFSIRSAQSGGYRNFALAGLGAGLAMACKTTAISLLPVVVLGVGIFAWPAIRPYLLPLWSGDNRDGADERDGPRLDSAVVTLVAGSAVALVAAFVAYRIAMPYAFNSPSLSDWLAFRSGHVGPLPFFYPDIMNQQWIRDQQDQQGLLSGGAFPPNVQWIGRAKWLWPMQQMVAWGMGPALGITAWLGVLFAIGYAVRKRAWVWLVPLAWVLGYFGFMGMQFSLYMRYFQPLYPALTVMAAFLLYKTWEWGSSQDPFAAFGRLRERLAPARLLAKYASRAGVGAVLVLTMAMGLAYYQIYTEPVTRVSASAWIQLNIPEGAVIGHEHWDDPVPMDVAGVERRTYGGIEFQNFNGDSPERVEQLLLDIEAVDYIALSSQRLSTTIPRVPAVWPVTSRYYEALASGELGFSKIAEFTSYPEIFGIELNDDASEESFTVYDHPKVVIFEKTDDYSPDRARAVLGADAFSPGVPIVPKDSGQNALHYRPDVLARQQAGGTWSDIFDPGSVVNGHPLLFWLLTLEIAAFALVPLALMLFRGLPDRGYLLTKPLGVLGLSYLVYAPSGHGLTDFTRTTIATALAVMVAVGVATAYIWRAELRTWFAEHWRFVLLCEAVFLGIFLFSYWLRIQNPDLFHPYNGGEKPMDFAYFNGVLRSTDMTQGPIDPWHAGGYLNYYWWGFFIAATPTKLLGVVPEVAYNLVVPMFFALSAAGTFSIAYNLTESTRRFMKRRPNRTHISARGPIVAALLAVFLVLIAGNLRAVDVLEQNFSAASQWHSDLPIVNTFAVIAGGLWESVFGDAKFRDLVYSYDWWGPSRALTILPDEPNQVQPITEFPFWTFLFADLHAHLMAIPFALTAVGVSLGVVLNFTRLNPARRLRGAEVSSWVMVALIGLIVGALRWINSWDYPVFLLMGAAAILIGEYTKERLVNGRAFAVGLIKIAVMGVLSYAFFSVVAKNYSQSYSSVNRADQTTDLSDFLSHFGVFLFLIAGLLTFTLSRVIAKDKIVRTFFFGSKRPGAADAVPVIMALLLLAAAVIWAGTLARWGVVWLSFAGITGIVLCAVRELRKPSPLAPVMLFIYSMTALGLGLTGGVDLFTLDGDVGRTNTVFKFYLHVWLLWGIVAAYAAWFIVDVMRPHQALVRRANEFGVLVRVPRYAFAGIAAVLLLLTLIYPYFGTRARVHNRFDPAMGASNDGLAWLDEVGIYDNSNERGTGGTHDLKYTRDAITWVRENIVGSPTTIEAIGESYRSLGSRIAINTGLPTVSGWRFHQTQQRKKFEHTTVDTRDADVNEFYATEDIGLARAIIREYGVEWVIVGDEEAFNYPAEGLAKFQSGLGGLLELAYENPAIRIFHVIPDDELADASASAR